MEKLEEILAILDRLDNRKKPSEQTLDIFQKQAEFFKEMIVMMKYLRILVGLTVLLNILLLVLIDSV